jgi:hypothetical protein
MLEFVEAPLSFLLGVPTASLKLIDPIVLTELVVVDIDNASAGNPSSVRYVFLSYILLLHPLM